MIQRMALHAFSLEFRGLDGVSIQCEAPYPRDMAALLRQLRANKA